MTWQELYNAQMELVDDKKVQEAEWLDWNYSNYYLKLTISEKYEIYEVLFMCDCFYSLVYSLKWSDSIYQGSLLCNIQKYQRYGNLF